MSDHAKTDEWAQEEQGPVVRDKRRLDPQTGEVREDLAEFAPKATTDAEVNDQSHPADAEELQAAKTQATELKDDLQRLQAEFVNYRKRVDRDRDVAKNNAISTVLESLLPVLDDITLARQHGDLADGPFAAIADKLEETLKRFGLSQYGKAGDGFDPKIHEALMHQHSDEVTQATITQVIQPGYLMGEKVLRATRVVVADPQ